MIKISHLIKNSIFEDFPLSISPSKTKNPSITILTVHNVHHKCDKSHYSPDKKRIRVKPNTRDYVRVIRNLNS